MVYLVEASCEGHGVRRWTVLLLLVPATTWELLKKKKSHIKQSCSSWFVIWKTGQKQSMYQEQHEKASGPQCQKQINSGQNRRWWPVTLESSSNWAFKFLSLNISRSITLYSINFESKQRNYLRLGWQSSENCVDPLLLAWCEWLTEWEWKSV